MKASGSSFFTALFRLNPDYSKRIFGLDLMRALAIIFVVIGHGSMLEQAHTNFPWIRLINGVELFFVLSGFLIGGILIKTFNNNSFGIKSIWNFWVRRWFRTLPNYYLVLFLNIVFVYFGIIQGDISKFSWKFFLFLQNFSGPFTDFFWESWSLSVEEWFYLLFPVILIILYLSIIKLGKKAVFLTAILVFLTTPFLLRLFVASKFQVDEFWLGVRIYKVVIFRMDGIAFGLIAAFIKYYKPALWFKCRNVSFIAGIILSYVLLYVPIMPNDFFAKVLWVAMQSLGCFLLLPKFDSIRKAPKFIVKTVTHISLISYSMYLINLALVSQVITYNFQPQTARGAWFSYACYWFCVIVFSTLIYKYFEKPVMDLRRVVTSDE